MNREQEDLIATGLWLLIKSNDKLKTSTKDVWMMDYDKLFGEIDSQDGDVTEPLSSDLKDKQTIEGRPDIHSGIGESLNRDYVLNSGGEHG